MDDRFLSVLEDAFPEHEIDEMEDHEPLSDERNGTVYVDFSDGGRVFCKIAVDGERSRLGVERAVIEYVSAHCDVPVPTVLASDTDGPVPYLITAPIAGRKLADVKWDTDRSGEERVMEALGRTLARVHAQRFNAHGDITGGSADRLNVDSGSWTDVFVEHVHGIREFAHSNRFDRYVDDVIAGIKANRAILNAAPATLVHDDPNGANCYYSEPDVGLLDWEHAHIGDPARDLHRVLEQQFGLFRPEDPDHQVTALHEGYREQAGGLPEGFAERVAVYEVVRLLGASAFFDSKVGSTDESREELADWMDAEMERRLAAIR